LRRYSEILILLKYIVVGVFGIMLTLKHADDFILDVAILIEADDALQGLDTGFLDRSTGAGLTAGAGARLAARRRRARR
jgi:hypothetical protein